MMECLIQVFHGWLCASTVQIVLLVNLQMQHHVGHESLGMYLNWHRDTHLNSGTLRRDSGRYKWMGFNRVLYHSQRYRRQGHCRQCTTCCPLDLCVVTLTCGSDKKGNINVWFFPTSPVFTEVTWFPSFQALWTYKLQRPGRLPMCWVSPVSTPAHITCVHSESSRTFHVFEEFSSFWQGVA